MDKVLHKQIKRKRELVHVSLTDDTEIKGDVHLVPDYRLIDLLNSGMSNKSFIAVTDACVKLPHGERISLPFVVININIIRLCFPIPDSNL